MFCPNGHDQFVIGPEYVHARARALMTCLQCGERFDAYEQYGGHAVRRPSGAVKAA